jgi:hypothetical protein
MAFAGGVVACSLALDLGSLDEGCPADAKLCNGACVPLDDPKTGCGPLRTCAPCALYNAASYSCRSDTNECFVTRCLDGFDDCDARAKSEVVLQNCGTNLDEDPLHCGDCSTQCVAPDNAEPACGGGRCYTLCKVGWGDCNRDPSDGCEINLLTDANNCGKCQNVCPDSRPNSQAVCVDGACPCLKGWADCDQSNPTNGCEAELAVDEFNCGACGVVCAQGQICTAGACVTP